LVKGLENVDTGTTLCDLFGKYWRECLRSC